MATTLVASRTNSLDTPANAATARLVLAVGSRAGREAPLQCGYYMIGRHGECQIRPKSRSVSRRHCLLFQDDTGLKVFDLGSTAGTRVNDLRLRPQTWTTLRHGDMLRCGKVAFRVDLGKGPPQSHLASSDTPAEGGDTNAMPVGQAWHDIDIAGFMESQDDADRERRYDNIRSARDQNAGHSDDPSDDLQKTIEMDVDLDLFDDAFDDPSPTSSPDRGVAALEQNHSTSLADAAAAKPNEATHQPVANSRTKAKAARRSQPAAKRPARQTSSRRFSIGIPADAELWKLIGLVLLMLTVVVAAGYSGYQFYSGPDVRVLRSID